MKKVFILMLALIMTLGLVGCSCDHELVVDSRIEPTCLEEGLTEGTHCSLCNEVLTKQATIPALGHEVVTDDAVEATLLYEGKTAGKHCSRCDEILEAQESIPAIDSTVYGRSARYSIENGEDKGRGAYYCQLLPIEGVNGTLWATIGANSVEQITILTDENAFGTKSSFALLFTPGAEECTFVRTVDGMIQSVGQGTINFVEFTGEFHGSTAENSSEKFSVDGITMTSFEDNSMETNLATRNYQKANIDKVKECINFLASMLDEDFNVVASDLGFVNLK